MEIDIKLDDENPFNPIKLNCSPGEGKNDFKGKITSLVTYKTRYKYVNNKPILYHLALLKM